MDRRPSKRRPGPARGPRATEGPPPRLLSPPPRPEAGGRRDSEERARPPRASARSGGPREESLPRATTRESRHRAILLLPWKMRLPDARGDFALRIGATSVGRSHALPRRIGERDRAISASASASASRRPTLGRGPMVVPDRSRDPSMPLEETRIASSVDDYLPELDTRTKAIM